MGDKQYYVAPQIESKLLKNEKIKRDSDQDRVYIITGAEGSGKSLLARQLACRIDKEFSLKDITFTSDEFAKRVRDKKQFGSIVFDEANNGLSSKGAISRENKKLIKLLQECRQRNLTIFIVLPSVFLLEKYVILFRSHTLFHTCIYRKDYKKRYYLVYNKRNKKLLYMLGHKFMSYSKPKLHKKYRFYESQPEQIDKIEYNDKKLRAFRDEDREGSVNDVVMNQRNILLYTLNKQHKIKYSEISRILKESDSAMDESSIGKIIRNISDKKSNKPHST